MGGSWQQKKTVVEDCMRLDTRELMRTKTFRLDSFTRGTLQWANEFGLLLLSAEYECNRGRTFRLRYRTGSSRSHDYEIRLITTEARPFGGEQFWFLCPMCEFSLETERTIFCKRKVRKLYLPPGWDVFGCRVCYNLTYRSCQQSHCRSSQPPSWLQALGGGNYPGA